MSLDLLLIYIFSLIGIADTSYLVYHKIRGTDVACVFFPREWCQKVQYSPQSKTFGIPNSVAGLVMYFLIVILAAAFSYGVIPFWPLQIVVGFGFLFSLYFTFVQAFVLKAFCTWCVISAIDFTVLAAAAFLIH